MYFQDYNLVIAVIITILTYNIPVSGVKKIRYQEINMDTSSLDSSNDFLIEDETGLEDNTCGVCKLVYFYTFLLCFI